MKYCGSVTMDAQDFVDLVETVRKLEQELTLTKYELSETKKKLAEKEDDF